MKRNKWGVISLIGLVFSLPVIGAWLFYLKAHEWHLTTTNRGVLLQPPLQISELGDDRWRGHWLLLYVDRQCADQCVTAAENLAEINIVLGQERTRVRSVLATLPMSEAVNELVTHINPQLAHLRLSPASLEYLLNADDLATEAPDLERALFVVDPLGNIILYYAVPVSTKAVYRDMKKLLRASQIG